MHSASRVAELGWSDLTIMEGLRSIGDAIRSEIEPLLRARNFEGKYPHYRRKMEGRADLISFQTHQYGGSFVIEIAQAPGEGFRSAWSDEFVSFEKMNPSYLDPHRDKRERILAGPFGLSGWFHYDRLWQKLFLKKPERLRFAARSAAKKIPRMEKFFETWYREPH